MIVIETLDGTQEEEMQLTQIPSDSSAVSAMISKSAMDWSAFFSSSSQIIIIHLEWIEKLPS